jgi:hypothetical protein
MAQEKPGQTLRKLAAQRLAQEKPGQTLRATALVHEPYLLVVDVDKVRHWDSRGHFFAAAAELSETKIPLWERLSQLVEVTGAQRPQEHELSPVVTFHRR